MNIYTVKFLTAGQKVIRGSREFRTPVTFEKVSEKDLPFFQLQARQKHLQIDISETKDNVTEIVKEIILPEENEDVKVEEFDSEPSTILEKLLKENE